MWLGPGERRPPEEVTVARVDARRLRGKPRQYGDLLYVADRTRGDVTIVDISDPEKPALQEHFNVPGNPASVILHRDVMVIPNGYEGLWIENR